MANTVTSQTLVDDEDRVVVKFTNQSDGTAETALKKVDVSTFNASGLGLGNCSGVIIEKIVADISGMTVKMLWDATADTLCFTVSESGTWDFRHDGVKGIENDAGAGKTGDLMFTTIGHTSGDYYSIVLYMRKEYSE